MQSILLEALRYPNAKKFNVDNIKDFRTLVYWLENKKIRGYKIEQRTVLQDVNSPNWDEEMQKYLMSMECPIPYNPDNKQEIIQWLLQTSIGLEYKDNKSDLNGYIANTISSYSKNKDMNNEMTFKDAMDGNVKEMILNIATSLEIDINSSKLLSMIIKEIENVMVNKIIPSITNTNDKGFDLSRYPLGFTTGDKLIDKAAIVMRLLFLKDLRELQTSIDQTIVKCQEYTANPKTDSRLGRVGR